MSKLARYLGTRTTQLGVGVVGWNYSPAIYVAATHNPSSPLRPGSQDAFQCPSLDHAGNRRPYWALEKK